VGPNEYTLGYDTTFELDDFSKPRLRGESELVKNVVLFILFTKPGQYPSLPHIGLDIQNRLHSFYDELREEDLKSEIISQCSALGVYFKNGAVDIRKAKYRGKPSLMIHISTTTDNTTIRDYSEALTESSQRTFQIGITFDELNQMIYNISDGRRS